MNTLKTVFLVEDDKDDQMFFSECVNEIQNANLFDIANNGREALDKLDNAPILPDIIFMDINMPIINGLDCLTEIMNNPRTKNISVVMLSTDTIQARLTLNIGAKAFIKKSSDFQMLKTKVEQMINLDFNADYEIANQTFQPHISTH